MSDSYAYRAGLADSWLGVAEQLLAEGKTHAAQEALDRAREHLAVAERLLPSAPLG